MLRARLRTGGVKSLGNVNLRSRRIYDFDLQNRPPSFFENLYDFNRLLLCRSVMRGLGKRAFKQSTIQAACFLADFQSSTLRGLYFPRIKERQRKISY